MKTVLILVLAQTVDDMLVQNWPVILACLLGVLTRLSIPYFVARKNAGGELPFDFKKMGTALVSAALAFLFLLLTDGGDMLATIGGMGVVGAFTYGFASVAIGRLLQKAMLSMGMNPFGEQKHEV